MSKNLIIYKAIQYLNSKANTDFKKELYANDPQMLKLIEVGYNYDHFKLVIDKKVQDWKGTNFEQYLRPYTLFGAKFENYLNEKQRTTTNKIEQIINAVEGTRDIDWGLDKE
jgi:uncharacterized phage protein (TIGR02220 family)